MQLKVQDRLMLLSVLPQEGNIVTLRIIRELSQELSFSEEEMQQLEIKQVGDKVVWRQELDTGKDVAIGPAAKSLIIDRLVGLNKSDKLTLPQLALYEKFVEAEE